MSEKLTEEQKLELRVLVRKEFAEGVDVILKTLRQRDGANYNEGLVHKITMELKHFVTLADADVVALTDPAAADRMRRLNPEF